MNVNDYVIADRVFRSRVANLKIANVKTDTNTAILLSFFFCILLFLFVSYTKDKQRNTIMLV